MAISPRDRLAGIRIKIERAKQHIADLNSRHRAFLDSNPYGVGTKRDGNTRQLIYDVTDVNDTPVIIPALTGEAIQGLRSALDYVVYQLVLKNGCTPTTQTCFPICETAAIYKTEGRRKVKGVHPDAIKVISDAEP